MTPNAQRSYRYDVLVVGAGPAGLATAITATRNGASVLLVERHSGTTIYPRATGVSTRSMELFRTWGVADAVRAGAVEAQPLMSVGSTLADRHRRMPFGYPVSAREVLAVSPTVPVCCPQDHIESVLAAHLGGLGGEIRFSAQLADLSRRRRRCDRAPGRPAHRRRRRRCGRATWSARTGRTARYAARSASRWTSSAASAST